VDADVVSHYDWLDNQRILIWARDKEQPGHFWLVDAARGDRRVIGAGVLVEDGHVSFSPDRKWVLNDTYPDRYDMRTLMLFRWTGGERIDLARLHSPKSRWWGEIRCDLHPRWSRNGTRVCIDSVHTGERQMYVADVGEFVA
jgi:Tol biopolymer transport system component